MASMRDIKRRKESVQSTGQITKAMKLVSSVISADRIPRTYDSWTREGTRWYPVLGMDIQ